MKKSGILHSEEEKAGDGEVYKTEVVGKSARRTDICKTPQC